MNLQTCDDSGNAGQLLVCRRWRRGRTQLRPFVPLLLQLLPQILVVVHLFAFILDTGPTAARKHGFLGGIDDFLAMNGPSGGIVENHLRFLRLDFSARQQVA